MTCILTVEPSFIIGIVDLSLNAGLVGNILVDSDSTMGTKGVSSVCLSNWIMGSVEDLSDCIIGDTGVIGSCLSECDVVGEAKVIFSYVLLS
jgi:hypothetical protein